MSVVAHHDDVYLNVVKNSGRFCAAEEMICACVYVCVRERE